MALCRSGMRWELWVTPNGYEAASWYDDKVLNLGYDDYCKTLCLYRKSLNCTF